MHLAHKRVRTFATDLADFGDDDDGYPAREEAFHPPVDIKHDYPDLVSDSVSVGPSPVLYDAATEENDDEDDVHESQEQLFPTLQPVGEYVLPDRSLLKKSKPGAGPNGEASQRIAEALVTCLAHFGVEATVIGTIAGPRVTRYELQLAPGTKVGKVANLKDDLSYALATTEIRILAPIPGKQAVGVEVPNLSPNLVTLGDIYDDLPQTASPLSVWLGKDISGASVWADLARMPHILIAGTTGSGKSGCINTILTSILLRATPDEARLILIDPKRIELNYYESIPHLLTPVVSSPKEASAVLLNVVTEMERRYERLSQVRARNLPGSEPRVPQARRGRAAVPAHRDRRARRPDDGQPAGSGGLDHPPRAEVARSRHPSRARDAAAVGRRDHRHDQGERPVADRVRRLLADRLARDPRRERRGEPARPGRHALQAARHVPPAARPGRVRDRGRDRAGRRAGARPARAAGRRDVPRAAAGVRRRGDSEDGEFDPDEDALLDKAIEVVVTAQTASVSLLQRRLRVGYTRAGRLIDMLERRGIISPYEGSKPRRVLISEHELERVAD